jgi:hypothetical protein
VWQYSTCRQSIAEREIRVDLIRSGFIAASCDFVCLEIEFTVIIPGAFIRCGRDACCSLNNGVELLHQFTWTVGTGYTDVAVPYDRTYE